MVANIISNNWNAIETKIKADIIKYKKMFDNDGLDISNKMFSEFISQITEKAFERGLQAGGVDVRLPKSDNEADVIVEGTAVEIKTTSGDTWRGGSFSKRPGHYVLLSWEIVDDTVNLYAAQQHMEESDWVGDISAGKYYATSYSKFDLLRDNKYTELCGQLTEQKYKKDGTLRKKAQVKLVKG